MSREAQETNIRSTCCDRTLRKASNLLSAKVSHFGWQHQARRKIRISYNQDLLFSSLGRQVGASTRNLYIKQNWIRASLNRPREKLIICILHLGLGRHAWEAQQSTIKSLCCINAEAARPGETYYSGIIFEHKGLAHEALRITRINCDEHIVILQLRLRTFRNCVRPREALEYLRISGLCFRPQDFTPGDALACATTNGILISAPVVRPREELVKVFRIPA